MLLIPLRRVLDAAHLAAGDRMCRVCSACALAILATGARMVFSDGVIVCIKEIDCHGRRKQF